MSSRRTKKEHEMCEHLTRATALALTLLVLASCNQSPTEPLAVADGSPAAAAVAALPGSWTTRTDYPRDVFRPMSAAVTTNGRSTVYVIGGRPAIAAGAGRFTDVVFAYDVTGNQWRRLADFPIKAQGMNNAVEINGKVYVAGALSRRWNPNTGTWVNQGTNTLYLYDPAANTWTRKHDLPIVSDIGLASTFNGLLYFAAPCFTDCSAPPNGGLYRYNPSTDRWKLIAATPHDPQGAAGGFVGGKLYLVANAASSTEHGPVDIYDPATGQWSSGPSVPSEGFCAGPSTTLQSRVYLFGCNGTQVLDAKAGTWTQAVPPPNGDNAGFGTVSKVLVNGQPRIELVGGARPGNNVQFTP
jgi:hypothetical protein